MSNNFINQISPLGARNGRLALQHHSSACIPAPQGVSEPLLRAMWGTPEGIYWVGEKPSTARSFHGLEAALLEVRRISAVGGECFYGIAVYRDAESRSASNASGAWGLCLDLDVGLEKAASGEGYVSPDAARAALMAFCEATAQNGAAPLHGQACLGAEDS